MKKVGQFLVCFVPMIAMVALQSIVSFIVSVVMAVRIISQAMHGANGYYSLNIGEILSQLSGDTDYLLMVIVIYEAVAIIAFGLFYLLQMKGSLKTSFSVISVPALVITFVGVEALLGFGLCILQYVSPELMADYAESMASSGLTEMNLLSTIATLILAPVAEEFVFRGITFKLARRFSGKFWVANIIQAAIFGIAHFNLVQGAYAFAMGLVLGYVYKRYNSIVATMICHLTFNFTGTYLVSLFFGDGDEVPILRLFIVAVVALLLIEAGFTLMRKDKKAELGELRFLEMYEIEKKPVVKAQPAGSVPPYGNPYAAPYAEPQRTAGEGNTSTSYETFRADTPHENENNGPENRPE